MKPGSKKNIKVGVVAPKKKQTRKMKPRKIMLTGDERYWIQNRIEKLKMSERTLGEKRLLKKVERKVKSK